MAATDSGLVQRLYLRDEDGHLEHGMVQLVHRDDGGLLIQLDQLADGETTSSACLFLRPGEADQFRSLVVTRGGVMRQEAPYPAILERLVGELTYRAGWQFSLEDIDRGQGSLGLTFVAVGMYPDSYHPDRTIRVAHYFPVPPAAYNEQSWRRWLLDRVLEIERHEACEFFKVDGERPYAPHHGPGNDPYIVFEHGSDIERRTSFRGDVKISDGENLERMAEAIYLEVDEGTARVLGLTAEETRDGTPPWDTRGEELKDVYRAAARKALAA